MVLHDPPSPHPTFSRTRCECRCVSAELPVNVLNWQPGHLRGRAGGEQEATLEIHGNSRSSFFRVSKRNRYVLPVCQNLRRWGRGGGGGVGNWPGLLSGNRGQSRDPRGKTAKK